MRFNNKRVKAERIARGLSQEKMADVLGLSRQAYMRKENGKRPLAVDELVTICQAFKMPEKDILIFFEDNVDNRLHGENRKEVS